MVCDNGDAVSSDEGQSDEAGLSDVDPAEQLCGFTWGGSDRDSRGDKVCAQIHRREASEGTCAQDSQEHFQGAFEAGEKEDHQRCYQGQHEGQD